MRRHRFGRRQRWDDRVGILPVPDEAVGILPLPITEVLRINQRTEGVTVTPSADLHNHNIRFSFAPIWTYRIPPDALVTFNPGHRFYLNIFDGAGAHWHDRQRIRIVMWNAVEDRALVVYRGLYEEVRESTDIDRMAMLELAAPHIMPADSLMRIEGLAEMAPHTINSPIGHFSIESLMTRKRI